MREGWSRQQEATMGERVEVISEAGLVDADPTPGMRRRRAFTTPQVWAGMVHTEVGMVSGWHHHGDHDTMLYVLAGRLRLEFGPGGTDAVEAGPGDFLRVPPNTVHRESNPAAEPSTAVIARAGTGAVTVNVDGPDPA
jgi:uncharacterized RmlC-like cupin family protein